MRPEVFAEIKKGGISITEGSKESMVNAPFYDVNKKRSKLRDPKQAKKCRTGAKIINKCKQNKKRAEDGITLTGKRPDIGGKFPRREQTPSGDRRTRIRSVVYLIQQTFVQKQHRAFLDEHVMISVSAGNGRKKNCQ